MSAKPIVKDLHSEVEELVLRGIYAGECVNAEWVVARVMANHPPMSTAEFPEMPWYTKNSRDRARDTVHRVLRHWGVSEKAAESDAARDDQLVLKGFKRVRICYAIKRDGDHWVVPIDKMTVAEIRGKAKEYRAMGVGCLEHEEELERYANQREHLGQ